MTRPWKPSRSVPTASAWRTRPTSAPRRAQRSRRRVPWTSRPPPRTPSSIGWSCPRPGRSGGSGSRSTPLGSAAGWGPPSPSSTPRAIRSRRPRSAGATS